MSRMLKRWQRSSSFPLLLPELNPWQISLEIWSFWIIADGLAQHEREQRRAGPYSSLVPWGLLFTRRTCKCRSNPPLQGDQGGTEVYEGGYNYLYAHAGHNPTQVWSFLPFIENNSNQSTDGDGSGNRRGAGELLHQQGEPVGLNGPNGQ